MGYLDGRLKELRYEDAGVKWFITGDVGRNERRWLSVRRWEDERCDWKGRFEHIRLPCLRAAYTILMEWRYVCHCALLGFTILSLLGKAQVIGIPYDHYGAVLIAVLKLIEVLLTQDHVQLFTDLNKEVVREQGVQNQLDAMYMLQEIGVYNWPLKSTNKIMKSVLLERVSGLRAEALELAVAGGTREIEA